MRMLPITACIALFAAACSNTVDGRGPRDQVSSTTSGGNGPSNGLGGAGAVGTGGAGGPLGTGGALVGSGGGTPITQGPPATFMCPPAQPAGAPPQRRLWRLSPAEFSNTVGDFLGGRRAAGSPVAPMPANLVNPLIPAPAHFSTDSGYQTVTPDEFTQASNVTRDVADQLVQSLKGSSCWGTDQSEACVRTVVGERGSILFRRPVTDVELTQYAAAFADAKLELSADESLSTVLQGMLLAPQFLFKPEIGSAPAANVVSLTPYEIATHLAYSITSSSPDQELWAAAQAGLTPEQIKTQVLRLMSSPEAHGARNFVTEYFELRKLLDVQKQLETDTQGMPCPYDRKGIIAQAEALVGDVYATNSKSAFFETLFSTETVFADCGSGGIFGVTGAPAVGSAPAKFTAPANQRAGFLTHPAWLGLKGTREETKPMKRGEFIFEEVFCTDIPAVDLNAVPKLPDDPNLTLREKFVSHVGLGCSGCHSLIDPMGLSLETYDAVGAYRATTTPVNKTIDASGVFFNDAAFGDLANVAFKDGVEMSKKLSTSNTVKECVMRNSFRYYMGRRDTVYDSCSLTNSKTAYDMTAGSYVEFVSTLATSDSFMLRSF